MSALRLSWRFAAAALAGLWLGLGPGPTPGIGRAAAALPDRVKAAPEFPLVGAGSCSARACHGGIEPVAEQGVLRNEYTTWLTQDKHARAYDVLLSERSKTIAKNLGAKTGTIVPAHEDARCLACHSISSAAPATANLAVLRQSGVSCEACHGPAGKWLPEHTTRSWAAKSPEEKQRVYGMTPTRDLARRAEGCVGCHVGAAADPASGIPVRDANHVIMAAGHPRLNFEFGAFLADMPHHWIERDQGPAFDARVWAVGQVVTARAALELLEYRARLPRRTWPELAEYDCFACHHALGPAWRQTRRHDDHRKPGFLPWGTWYFPMPRVLATQTPGGDPKLVPLLDDLDKLMTEPGPDRQREVARQAHAAAGLLGPWVKELDRPKTYNRATLGKLLESIAADGRQLAQSTWDGATQVYLALVALNRVYQDRQMDAPIEAMDRDLNLAFPPNDEGPGAFRPQAVDDQLRKIRQQIRK